MVWYSSGLAWAAGGTRAASPAAASNFLELSSLSLLAPASLSRGSAAYSFLELSCLLSVSLCPYSSQAWPAASWHGHGGSSCPSPQHVTGEALVVSCLDRNLGTAALCGSARQCRRAPPCSALSCPCPCCVVRPVWPTIIMRCVVPNTSLLGAKGKWYG